MEKNTRSYIRKENKNVNSYFGDAEKCFIEKSGGAGEGEGVELW